jgi:hypothetical protein
VTKFSLSFSGGLLFLIALFRARTALALRVVVEEQLCMSGRVGWDGNEIKLPPWFPIKSCRLAHITMRQI